MPKIRIKLLGNIAFKNDIKLSEGFKYDIPVDPMGIPYIPLAELLPEEILRNWRVGFAFPEGYIGLAKAADNFAKLTPNIKQQIRACFTDKRFYAKEGYWIRFLKAGQVFYANVYAQKSDVALNNLLNSITRLGIEKEGISGLVKCSIDDQKLSSPRQTFQGCDLKCDRLEYTLMPVTPMCIHAPYADGVRTLTFVPGGVLRDTLQSDAGDDLKARLQVMRFSNAYISDGAARLLPLPLCMSLVKLDKKQLHYRLSSGKDPNRVDQDVSPGDAYARGFESFLTTYTRPETERIISRDGAMYDVLCRGQMFRGVIYGDDEDLRALYAHLSTRPELTIGHLTREGFGQVYLKAELCPAHGLSSECLARTFDVSCLSHALIMGGRGMPEATAEGFLGEIERALHFSGRLRIVSRYMDVYEDISWKSGWGQEGPALRCLAKGSVMRLETADGTPVNIAPILHTFIGEQTRDGYGEIMAYPAQEGYYRSAEMVSPEKYGMELPLNYLSLHLSADMTDRVIRQLLKRRIQWLALSDRRDVPALSGEAAPLDLLRFIKDRFDPSVSDELLIQWYRQALEEDGDGYFFEE